MKTVNLEEIEDPSNSYFHFTSEENLFGNDGIMTRGLTSIPKNRPHAVKGDKRKDCIYFVQGYEGILELMDVWLRYEYSELTFKENGVHGYVKFNEERMKRVYDRFFEKLKNAKYLKLDLKPGNDPNTSDFDPQGEDFKKKEYFRRSISGDENTVDNPLAKWNYGINTDYTTARMDRWNMNTHLDHKGEKLISPDRIAIMQDSRGRSNALNVVLEIYKKHKDLVKNIGDLDKFIQYIEKEKDLGEKDTQKLGEEVIEELKNTPELINIGQEMHKANVIREGKGESI